MSYNKNRPNVGLLGHTKVSKLGCGQKFISSSFYFWRGSGQNSDSDLLRFEIQMWDMHSPPNRASLLDQWINNYLAKWWLGA